MKTWYTIKAQADDAATIDIFDDIGLWGITAKDFIGELKALGAVKKIHVRINSYGGDVFDGLAIYNALKFHEAKVEVLVMGIAASIASVIAMAGDTIKIPENAFLFLHNVIGFSVGNSADMRELADDLDKISSGLVRTYISKSGQSAEKIQELMDAETWLDAEEAKALGFADEILSPVKLAARADLKRYKNLPANLTKTVDEIEAAAEKESSEAAARAEAAKAAKANALTADSVRANALAINELCKKHNVADLAGDFLAGGLSAEQVTERLKDAGDIRSACLAAKLPDRAQRYIKAGFSLQEVRADLFEVLKVRDIDIDNRLPIKERSAAPVALIDSAAILAKWRRS